MMQNESCLSRGKLQSVRSKTTCCNRNCNLYGRKGLPVLCVQVTACIYQLEFPRDTRDVHRGDSI